MRNSSIGHIRDMTYEYYLKQLKSMCDWKINQIKATNPQLVKCLDRKVSPLVEKYSHILDIENNH